MEFTHTDDRQMLADTLRRFLAERNPIEARNASAYGADGFSRTLWSELGELGMTGALFDADAGGFGGGGFDIMVMFEEIGRNLAVEPLFGTLTAGIALARAGHPAAAGVIDGGTIAAFAHEEGEGPFAALTTAAAMRDGNWVLDGHKTVIAQGEAADLLVVSAGTSAGPALFVVPRDAPGVTARGYANIDGGRSADITLTNVTLSGDALVGGEGDGARLLAAAVDAGLLALSAEAIGAMEAVKAMTIDYLRTRVQFGQPIGRFQALQHRMATLLIEIEQARSAVINAAAAFDAPDNPARDRILSAAKYTAGRAGTMVAEEAIQLHGGVGMTWELALSHYAKRLTMIDHLLGDEDLHLQRYIAVGSIAAA